MKKAQGSLEYLIIIAAVLAIAAIVVLFLTGAFKSTNKQITQCKTAAASCATQLATSKLAELNGVEVCDYSENSPCYKSCVVNGKDVVTGSTDTNQFYGLWYCITGQPNKIYKVKSPASLPPSPGSPTAQ